MHSLLLQCLGLLVNLSNLLSKMLTELPFLHFRLGDKNLHLIHIPLLIQSQARSESQHFFLLIFLLKNISVNSNLTLLLDLITLHLLLPQHNSPKLILAQSPFHIIVHLSHSKRGIHINKINFSMYLLSDILFRILFPIDSPIDVIFQL